MYLFTEQKQLIDIENKLMVTTGECRGRDKFGVWDKQIHITIYKIDKQQCLTALYREIYLVSCNNLKRKQAEEEYEYMYTFN